MDNNKKKNKYSKGMTIIELIVVLSIFVIITTITIFNFGKYRSSESLNNLSDDIALAIRKAQSSATGSQLKSGSSSGYGVHFTASSNTFGLASNKNFILFTDISPNKVYNYTSNASCVSAPTEFDECSEILKINSSDIIEKIYVSTTAVTDAQILSSSDSGSLDIVFLRPNLNAFFCYKVLVSDLCTNIYGGNQISNIKIKISNNQTNGVKYISVWNTGQINVQ